MTVTDSVRSALSDRYSIEREIGAGGMATVYLARDIKHDREVAIKVLRADLSAMIGSERFLAEVRVAARLDHPHILTLIDSGSAGGILYYVLPYVRGESLRAKLDREKQLSLEESLSITKQVASALEYAHDQGIVHRDIKPENILLHEGEAVLADFGIALAVKEAGGNRLTETGLSLGTPQYMSPEQATGDRTLDRRSDIYSLGAVLYEMLSGEPPVTGATAQVVIAKLLTEKPVRLRVVRDTVPDGVERAVEKSLSKVPADRFKTAADFVRALEAAAPLEKSISRSNSARIAIPLAAVVLLLAAEAWFAHGRLGAKSGPAVTLGDRTQLTNTGKASSPMISADGKSIAYVVSDCGAAGCTYGIELKDIGEQMSHRVFSGAKSVYNPVISPDRRSILFEGTVGGRYGSWLISTLGGEPRWIAPQQAIFWADGDSLISIPALQPAKVFWLRVSGLDGIVRDSIRVEGPGDNVGSITAIPHSNWLLVPVRRTPRVEWLVIDRTGKVASRSTRFSYRGRAPIASYDAVWMSVESSGRVGSSVVRLPFDAVAGKLAEQGDTVYTGVPTGFSVNADGSAMVVDEGTTEYSTWALSMAELKSGVFPERAKVASATSPIGLGLSPDGSTLILYKSPNGATGAGRQISFRAFAGGPETPVSGNYQTAGFIDSTTLETTERLPNGVRLSRLNPFTGRKYASYIVADTNLIDYTNVGDRGWAWIPFDHKTIEISDSGDSRVRHIPIPAWYRYINQINSPPDGKQISFSGWRAPLEDSAVISTMSVADGKITRQIARVAEGIYVSWLKDGSLLLRSNETVESISLFRLVPGGKLELIANIPRQLAGVSVSADLKRATAGVRNYHGDVWMMKVNKR